MIWYARESREKRLIAEISGDHAQCLLPLLKSNRGPRQKKLNLFLYSPQSLQQKIFIQTPLRRHPPKKTTIPKSHPTTTLPPQTKEITIFKNYNEQKNSTHQPIPHPITTSKTPISLHNLQTQRFSLTYSPPFL